MTHAHTGDRKSKLQCHHQLRTQTQVVHENTILYSHCLELHFVFQTQNLKQKRYWQKKKTKNKEKGKHSRLSLPCCLLNDHWESNRYIRICPTYVTKPSVVISLSTSSSCLSDTVISIGFKWRLLEDRKEGKTAEFVHVKEKKPQVGE